MHQSANRGTTSRDTVRSVVAEFERRAQCRLDSDRRVARCSAPRPAPGRLLGGQELGSLDSAWRRSPMSRAIFDAPTMRRRVSDGRTVRRS